MTTDDQNVLEAPFQPYPMTTVAISAVSPEGYPITVTLNDPAPGEVGDRIQQLKKQGYKPPANPTRPAGG